MVHKTDKLGYKTDKKRKPTKLDTKFETKMEHQQNQALKLKLKWDTNQMRSDVDSKMVHKTDKVGHKIDKIGHQPNQTFKLKQKWDTSQLRQ